MNKTTTQTCFECGSELIIISSVTEQIQGSLFPQTTTIYRCTNIVCQEEKDRQAEKREKLLKDKAVADKQRLEKRIEDKRARERSRGTSA